MCLNTLLKFIIYVHMYNYVLSYKISLQVKGAKINRLFHNSIRCSLDVYQYIISSLANVDHMPSGLEVSSL